MAQRKTACLGALLLVLVAWAAFVRGFALGDRPFWTDEAWVAYAATHTSYGELLRQTDLPMPPLFAVSVKLLESIVAPPELGLRLLPALCGVACVPLTYLTVRTLRVPRTIAVAATSLCASSYMLVCWSRELKQYEVEAFFSILLAFLVFRYRDGNPCRRRWLLGLGVAAVCLLGPWFGYGMVFPAIALMVVLILVRPQRERRRQSLILGVTGLTLLMLSTLAVWRLAAAAQAEDPTLRAFTAAWLLDPFELRSWMRAARFAGFSAYMVLLPYEWTFGLTHAEQIVMSTLLGYGLWLVALLGLWAWPGRARREVACWVALPWLLMLLASIAQRYPFAQPRMMTVVAPGMIIAISAGVARLCRGCWMVFGRRSGVGLLLAMVISLSPALYMVSVPMKQECLAYHDFPALLERLPRERKPRELVAIGHMAVWPVRYYWHEQTEPLLWMPNAAGSIPLLGYDQDRLLRDIRRLGGPRWWLLTTTDEWISPRFRSLRKTLRRQGYTLEVVAQAGRNPEYGLAQLVLIYR